MIESELIPIANLTENNYNNNNNNEVIVNNNYQLKFPFSIKPVDPFVNQSLLKDFTGNKDYNNFSYSMNIENISIRDHHLQINHSNCSKWKMESEYWLIFV